MIFLYHNSYCVFLAGRLETMCMSLYLTEILGHYSSRNNVIFSRNKNMAKLLPLELYLVLCDILLCRMNIDSTVKLEVLQEKEKTEIYQLGDQ